MTLVTFGISVCQMSFLFSALKFVLRMQDAFHCRAASLEASFTVGWSLWCASSGRRDAPRAAGGAGCT